MYGSYKTSKKTVSLGIILSRDRALEQSPSRQVSHIPWCDPMPHHWEAARQPAKEWEVKVVATPTTHKGQEKPKTY